MAAAVLITVCTGIYMNWLYTEQETAAPLTETLDAEKGMGEETLMLEGDLAALSAGEDVQTADNQLFAGIIGDNSVSYCLAETALENPVYLANCTCR